MLLTPLQLVLFGNSQHGRSFLCDISKSYKICLRRPYFIQRQGYAFLNTDHVILIYA